ncbi:GIY-YIG nuclease family protein [Candidatus Woesebacteria bacterium]|nr:GIY-YIG nuclease family protein [Candidatus Woesebacteria bacterium]
MNIKKRIAQAPTTTGVYYFKTEKKYLYIGKSVNIRARLRSHVENAKIDSKAAAYVNQATEVSWIVTDSEFKALLLESQLIQKHRPKYNVRWMDDKSRLYIKITVKETYPKVSITRREDDKKALYIGPFSFTKTVKKIVKEVRRVFPFCMQENIGKRKCFYAKIGLCRPCPNEIEYAGDAKLKKALQKEYKKNIRNVVRVLQGKSDVVLKKLYKDLDRIKKNENYEQGIVLRNRIYRLERLINKRNFDVNDVSHYNRSEQRITSLLHILKRYLPDAPAKLERIECYDMSTMSFKNSTASMVVFIDGLSEKKEYKRFKIKSNKAESDFEMFEEVLTRRFKNKWQHPDLLVVDGGKPQVRIAQKVLAQQKLDIPLIGIAKRPDRLVIGDAHLLTVRPPRSNDGLQLIQEIRDESHRFARKYHLYLRQKRMMI